MKKIILLIAVLGAITAGWLLYFNNGSKDTSVSISEAKYMDLKNTLEFTGVVTPASQYNAMSQTGGTVDTVYAKEGDVVKKGDTLFSLDTTQVDNLLKQAKLNYDMLSETQTQTVMAQSSGLESEKAKVALALSQTTGYDYESFNNAFSNELKDNAAQMASSLNSMSLSEATGSSGAVTNVSNDKIKLADLQVQQLQAQLDNMSYKSTISGTVVSVNVHKGEVLAPGVPAMVIADTNDILINGYVYEKDMVRISKGMQVKIDTDSGYYKGTITDIAKAVQNSSGNTDYGTMVKVEITPDKSYSRIPGAEADLEAVINSKDHVLAVPLDCVTEDGKVFVIGKNNVIEKREVKTGFTTAFYAEITSGINEGEKVVLSPKGIKEGQRVSYD